MNCEFKSKSVTLTDLRSITLICCALVLLIPAFGLDQQASAAEQPKLLEFACQPKEQSFQVGPQVGAVIFEQNDCICAKTPEEIKARASKMASGEIETGLGYNTERIELKNNAASVKLYCYGMDTYNKIIHFNNAQARPRMKQQN